MTKAENKKHFKLPFHVVKRLDISKRNYWIIKTVGFLVALLLAGVLCTIFAPGTFVTFYTSMFRGIFNPNDPEILLEAIETAGLLLLIAFALAPAFKMRFWNIGAEGQISIGCLVTAGITRFMADGTNDTAVIIVCLISAIAAGIVWAVIPAIFKAIFNTNETLFTLMMNYVAIGLISLFISIWVTSGSQSFPLLTQGNLPKLGYKYIFNIIFVVIVSIIMIIYLKKTKHGYELSVVGASVNTAKYVGINVRKVIIRTMILSGAICGLVGFLLVSGHHHTLSANLAGGRGFTGVLIAWLGKFEPGAMILYAVLVAIFQRGSTKAASYVGINKSEFSAIVTGIFFLIVIATEFFANYKILFDEESKTKHLIDKFLGLFKKKEKIEQVPEQTNESKEDK